MTTLFLIVFIPVIIFSIWNFATLKFINPYTLNIVAGIKGSGKTTLLNKLAFKAVKKGRTVYTTETIPGTYKIDITDIGVYKMLPGSLVLIDEADIFWSNRNFKNFPKHVETWFKYQRHEQLEVWLFTQSFDFLDLKIRVLADNVYLRRRLFRIFTVFKAVRKKYVLVNSSADNPSTIQEDFYFSFPLSAGALKFCFIPKWSGLFDSFQKLPLQFKEWLLVPEVERSVLLSPIFRMFQSVKSQYAEWLARWRSHSGRT